MPLDDSVLGNKSLPYELASLRPLCFIIYNIITVERVLSKERLI